MKPLITLLAFVAGMLVAPVMAATLDLYSAGVWVRDRSEEQRLEGYARAIGEVAVRVTGSRDAALDPALAPVLDEAERFVQLSGYRTTENALWLDVRFDGVALEQALAQQGFPVWGPERPQTLLWLALEGGNRRILSDDETSNVRKQLDGIARQRGVPVILPLMDAEDRAAISFADIWGGFGETVRAASARYSADAILAGRGQIGPDGRYRFRWTLYVGDTPQSWSGDLSDGVQYLADFYAGEFAAALSGRIETTYLAVSGLSSLNSYGDVSRKFRRLSIVRAVDVDAALADTVVFRVALQGDLKQFERAITLDGSLTAANTLPAELPLSLMRPGTLYFEYRP